MKWELGKRELGVMYEDRTFRLGQIKEIFGVKGHFVIHLVETGIITPLQDWRGRGKSRVYSFLNLIEIGIFIHLSKFELSYERIKGILVQVDDMLEFYDQFVDAVTYISVLGLLNGKIMVFCGYDIYPAKVTPGQFLEKCTEGESDFCGIPIGETNAQQFLEKCIKREINTDLRKEDLAYYFVLDVGNIKRHIVSKIE